MESRMSLESCLQESPHTLNHTVVLFTSRSWNQVTPQTKSVVQRIARNQKIFLISPPVCGTSDTNQVRVLSHNEIIFSVIPQISQNHTVDSTTIVDELLSGFLSPYIEEGVVLWLENPKAIEYVQHWPRVAMVYDWSGTEERSEEPESNSEIYERRILEQTDLLFDGGGREGTQSFYKTLLITAKQREDRASAPSSNRANKDLSLVFNWGL